MNKTVPVNVLTKGGRELVSSRNDANNAQAHNVNAFIVILSITCGMLLLPVLYYIAIDSVAFFQHGGM